MLQHSRGEGGEGISKLILGQSDRVNNGPKYSPRAEEKRDGGGLMKRSVDSRRRIERKSQIYRIANQIRKQQRSHVGRY